MFWPGGGGTCNFTHTKGEGITALNTLIDGGVQFWTGEDESAFLKGGGRTQLVSLTQGGVHAPIFWGEGWILLAKLWSE